MIVALHHDTALRQPALPRLKLAEWLKPSPSLLSIVLEPGWDMNRAEWDTRKRPIELIGVMKNVEPHRSER
jgi:hypothetical protein